ncbi:MAG TPA: flagellar basal body rod C-terminal domain-containing protein, partial [Sphingopyxis sp.]|nr:flagellar basal body rod C-terminal domain-containing protein [Sphingopyxis sp.]
MDAFAISRTGMDVEWQRLQVIAQNIANMNTSRTAAGGYLPRKLVSGPATSFNQLMNGGGLQGDRAPRGVAVYDIATVSNGTRQVHDPRHPDADEAGYVHYPAISQAEEMTLMVKTSRAYEANLVSMAAALQ